MPEEDSVIMKVVRWTSRIRCLLCLLFLVCSVMISWYILKMRKVQQQNIPVWMLLSDGMTEQDAGQVWGQLTAGFEAVYPGYGVDLVIYTDADAYCDSLAAYLSDASHAPVACMNLPENCLTEMMQKADLSTLAQQLDGPYITDLTAFQEEMPLSWSVPVVLTADTSADGDSICWDMLPEEMQEELHAEHHADNSGNFNSSQVTELFANPEKMLLTDSAMCTVIQQNPALSGTVRMRYITEQDATLPIRYHDICCINAAAAPAQQQVAMRWVGYLLSQEAQEVLYTQHCYYFPMHAQAFADTARQHQEFSVLAELMETKGAMS